MPRSQSRAASAAWMYGQSVALSRSCVLYPRPNDNCLSILDAVPVFSGMRSGPGPKCAGKGLLYYGCNPNRGVRIEDLSNRGNIARIEGLVQLQGSLGAGLMPPRATWNKYAAARGRPSRQSRTLVRILGFSVLTRRRSRTDFTQFSPRALALVVRNAYQTHDWDEGTQLPLAHSSKMNSPCVDSALNIHGSRVRQHETGTETHLWKPVAYLSLVMVWLWPASATFGSGLASDFVRLKPRLLPGMALAWPGNFQSQAWAKAMAFRAHSRLRQHEAEAVAVNGRGRGRVELLT
ncbi:hypothetical protein B0H16DRAFT_1449107 [Mycena metata]|uniref:Uncharacterized protein n=1 Tax=Mycena metata TaxID=1033252 RepID=A0AAD7NX30_9AGAR|nr:hypothetical protein B0H16DRAFT_1449107 [Mycena metata]